jgi:hypothetical protein
MSYPIKHHCKGCGEDYTEEYRDADCKSEYCGWCQYIRMEAQRDIDNGFAEEIKEQERQRGVI